MNFELVHPYINYLIYLVIFTSMSSWAGDFIKNKSNKITLILFCFYISSVIGLSIINSIFLIFIYSAGYILNFDFAVNLIWIGLFIYCAREILHIFDDEFKGGTKLYKMIPKLIIIGPFIISFIIFYLLFYGDKIYKLSPHCENTKDPKIKACKYSNGTYTGEMKAFRRHGQGEYIWNSGKTYSGEWKNGKKLK